MLSLINPINITTEYFSAFNEPFRDVPVRINRRCQLDCTLPVVDHRNRTKMVFRLEKKKQLSALQEEKLKKFRESFVEEFQDAPLHAAVMSYVFYLYVVGFACIRDLMIRLGVRKSKEPKEYKNKVSCGYI